VDDPRILLAGDRSVLNRLLAAEPAAADPAGAWDVRELEPHCARPDVLGRREDRP
jgi:hypothetical protein